ncbi:hypothetical protein GCM10027570_05790 [Streptomonospora sediminis]
MPKVCATGARDTCGLKDSPPCEAPVRPRPSRRGRTGRTPENGMPEPIMATAQELGGLRGRRVLATGGSKRIGGAVASRLAAAGAAVVATASNDPGVLPPAVHSISADLGTSTRPCFR